MADKIIQLKDSDGNNLYPMTNGSGLADTEIAIGIDNTDHIFIDNLGAIKRITKLDAIRALTCLGAGLTTESADNIETWRSLGTGFAFVNGAGQIVGQPSTYGILVSQVYFNMITQTFYTIGDDVHTYIRAGNMNGWTTPNGQWVKQLTESDLNDLDTASFTKLWENASPSSAFAAQAVSVDLTEYNWVAIAMRNTTGGASCNISLAPVGVSSNAQTFVNISQNTTIYVVLRSFDVNTDSIDFKTCYYKASNAWTTAKTNNTYLIPVQIFGVKGVR